jgi:hypothetical protein
MINEELTFQKFGYYSTQWASKSDKQVVVNCDRCGKERIVLKRQAFPLCKSCVFIGRKFSKETLQKMSISMMGKLKGIPKPEGFSEKLREANTGKKRTTELKIRMSKIMNFPIGSKRTEHDGYAWIKIREDKKSWVREHRYVMEQYLSRELLPNEEVHHKGLLYPMYDIRNKSDNRIENLMVLTIEEHMYIHYLYDFWVKENPEEDVKVFYEKLEEIKKILTRKK